MFQKTKLFVVGMVSLLSSRTAISSTAVDPITEPATKEFEKAKKSFPVRSDMFFDSKPAVATDFRLRKGPNVNPAIRQAYATYQMNAARFIKNNHKRSRE